MSNIREPLYGAAAAAVRNQLREPTDLEVAVGVAQRLLDSDQVLSLREGLRLLLRALGAEPDTTAAADEPPAVTAKPTGPGCGAPASVCVEGYSPRDGRAHGSLDHAVYACTVHATDARTDWLHGFTTYTCAGTPVDRRCGERFDHTTLGGGQ
ncbi:hypothetical protein ABS735_28435 [Streptomyces sp. MMCC 100]|uniref:hypothetical protein n=1 Tax=Streptomyces sp. MMCC 100 TaxID=3163555 RepID=UPI0035989618